MNKLFLLCAGSQERWNDDKHLFPDLKFKQLVPVLLKNKNGEQWIPLMFWNLEIIKRVFGSYPVIVYADPLPFGESKLHETFKITTHSIIQSILKTLVKYNPRYSVFFLGDVLFTELSLRIIKRELSDKTLFFGSVNRGEIYAIKQKPESIHKMRLADETLTNAKLWNLYRIC